MSDDHDTFIKTPKQLVIVVIAAFAVPIALFALVSQFVTDIRSPAPDSQVAARIKPFGELVVADAGRPPGNSSGEQVFQAVCKTCHEAGIAGAPKAGDSAAWSAAIKKGYATLVQHAINGFQEGSKVMPPKGGNPDLADIEVERAVVYMANKSGARFQEPASPAQAAAAAVTPAAPTSATSPPPAAVAAASQSAPSPAASATASKSNAPLDAKSAEALMQKDGCAACHGIDKKIVGPAYAEVAAKYKGDAGALARLTQKVKSGGGGVWGPVPMPPNAQVPDDDIKALVSWILTLKK
ncbi:MAG: c-type cytochrome [Betaproteobacteria bacterium]|nr:MAG: c-type cytochrome [Betaproteobacteria bacterium]TMH06518.1 MAG: c-type cytochrome [Betaproteobacteria bacterium]